MLEVEALIELLSEKGIITKGVLMGKMEKMGKKMERYVFIRIAIR
jgi:hypothetical protein